MGNCFQLNPWPFALLLGCTGTNTSAGEVLGRQEVELFLSAAVGSLLDLLAFWKMICSVELRGR